MEISLDKHSANQASVKIKLNEADYQPKVDAKLKDYAKKANIKGFRPGKAPVSMVKKMYGTSVLVDEINEILSSSLNNYLKEQTFKILGDPLPMIEDADSIDWKTQTEFEFQYKIGFVEEIEFKLDDSLKATSYKVEMNDAEVEEAITNLRSQYGKMTNPEVSEENDFLYGDLKSEDGTFEKTFSLPLSKVEKKSLKKFVGVKKGDVVELDPSKAIKEDLAQTVGVEEEEVEKLSGKFTFTVQNINRTELADFNQEFFDKLFGPGQVDSEEAMRAKVQEIISDNYNKEAAVYSDEQIKDKLIESANIELPEAFLKEWLIRANEGKVTEEQVEKEYPIYAKQLTWTLISGKIAKDNEIKAEHEDVIEKTKEMIREQFASSGMGAQMEESMGMFVDNYLQGNEGQNYMQMLTSVQNDKVLAFVKEKANVKEEKISADKFKELLEN
ncbi:Cell division trigger factor [Indibacter alkaliphilus LW1]|uniref:Cell division trigger factor n=1 Tax=Indibacter alkaliphilus (strain CCUG 57479 / KCTC 22604 / LW1) TaxID=1189612 RepID=S2E4X3_INDAL|nr:trigger factor [Indibacter alkaliphilus]EOZ99621.1 Cell division trigger factor [Indibacter alkaliphilus LW1]